MLKKIARSPIMKALAFAVLLGSMFTGIYKSASRLYECVAEFPEQDMLYSFEGQFEDSIFLHSQLSRMVELLDTQIHDNWEWLAGPEGKVDPNRLRKLTERFIGSVSLRHNGVAYDGGASKENDSYYIEVTPKGIEYGYGDMSPYVATYMEGSLSSPGYENDYGEWVSTDNKKYGDTDFILVSISQDQALPYEDQWEQSRKSVTRIIWTLLAYVLAALAALVYLLCVTGKTAADEEVHLMLIDRMPVELGGSLFLCFLSGAGILIVITVEIVAEQLDKGFILLLAAGFALCVGLASELLLSLVREAKNRSFVSNSFILRALRWCLRKVKSCFKWLIGLHLLRRFSDFLKRIISGVLGSYKTRNVLLVFFGYSVVLAFLAALFVYRIDYGEGIPFVLGVIWFCMACSFLLKRINGFDKVVEGIKRLKAGELDYKLSGLPEGVFSDLASDINSLGDGMQAALQNEIRAERMKSELITNVSHDLKTPLTSILNYAELLCQEHLTPEEANDYAKIIYQKSLKLKTLTRDLFDISKVQSGAEKMDFERLDVCTLIRQSLAEQEQAIRESGLIIKSSIPEEDLPIWADGKKLSRVMENIIGNCTKYALKGTRVYISAKETEDKTAVIEVKNIANYEMDFDSEEITDRFVRGDKSRSTEGNGLGLAIAKSYVNAFGGTLEIEADGDLFKVRIIFPVYRETYQTLSPTL